MGLSPRSRAPGHRSRAPSPSWEPAGSAGRIFVGQVEELIGAQAAEFERAALGYHVDGDLQAASGRHRRGWGIVLLPDGTVTATSPATTGSCIPTAALPGRLSRRPALSGRSGQIPRPAMPFNIVYEAGRNLFG
jgi:hypothetical protein